jgi:peptidoglycan/LPS O-acetylase OafA/YrhL
MSGYREHSFDPNHWERQGPPIRPYNWAQWTGVGLALLGAVIVLAYLAGRVGWIPEYVESPMPGATLPLLGVALVNSRRQPIHDPAPSSPPPGASG